MIDTFHRPFENLTIGLATFDESFKPKPIVSKEKSNNNVLFRYSHIAYPPKKKIKQKIKSVIDKASEENVDILIFPELTIDHDGYTEICNLLSKYNSPDKIKLVVAGSFQKEREEGGYINQSTMLNWS